MPLVELRNVSKIYHLGGEEIRALDDVSLDIEAGEFISIIGPSGSGKSTLMHILGCLDSPSKGTINLDGTMIHDASASIGEDPESKNRVCFSILQSAPETKRAAECRVTHDLQRHLGKGTPATSNGGARDGGFAEPLEASTDATFGRAAAAGGHREGPGEQS